MAIVRDKASGKEMNVPNEMLVDGVHEGVFDLPEENNYSFHDGQVEKYYNGAEAKKIILSGDESLRLFDPESVELEPTVADQIVGGALNLADGHTGGLVSAAARTLGADPEELDFIKGSLGEGAQTALNIAGAVIPSPINVFGKVAGMGTSIAGKIAYGSLSGGAYATTSYISDKIGTDREITSDVLTHAFMGTVLGGVGTGLATGAGHLLKQAKAFQTGFSKKYNYESVLFSRAENLKAGMFGAAKNTPAGSGAGITFKFSHGDEAWVSSGASHKLYYGKDAFKKYNILDLDNPEIVNSLGGGKVIGLADELYVSTAGKLDDVYEASFIRQQESSLGQKLMDGSLTPEAHALEAQKLIPLAKRAKEAFTRRLDSQYDGYKLGDHITVRKSPAEIMSKLRKDFQMGEKRIGVVADVKGALTKSELALFEELNIDIPALAKHGVKEGYATREFSDMALMARKLVDRSLEGKSLADKIKMVHNAPKQFMMALDEALEQTTNGHNNLMAKVLSPRNVSLAKDGPLVSVGELFNHFKSSILDDMLGPNGLPSPANRSLYDKFLKFANTMKKDGAKITGPTGVRVWDKMDLNGLRDFVQKVGTLDKSGTMGGALAELETYGTELLFKRAVEFAKKSKDASLLKNLKVLSRKTHALKALTDLKRSVGDDVAKMAGKFNVDKVISGLKPHKIGGFLLGGPVGFLVSGYGKSMWNLYYKGLSAHLAKVTSAMDAVGTGMLSPVGKQVSALALPSFATNISRINEDRERLSSEEDKLDFELLSGSPISEFGESQDVLTASENIKNNLAKRLPKMKGGGGYFGKPLFDAAEERRYLRYRSAVMDPFLTVARIKAGIASTEEVDAIRENYKGLHKKLIEAVLANKDKLIGLRGGKREIIKRILGEAGSSWTPYFISQQAMSSENSQATQKERLRKMNLNAQMNSMSKSDSLQKKNLE